jgi:hypothetical protein
MAPRDALFWWLGKGNVSLFLLLYTFASSLSWSEIIRVGNFWKIGASVFLMVSLCLIFSFSFLLRMSFLLIDSLEWDYLNPILRSLGDEIL